MDATAALSRFDPGEPGAGGTSDQLQAIVEDASRALSRPIAIDDRHLRLLAYTQRSQDDVDSVSLMAIMRQPQPAEVFKWFEQHDAWTSERPLRIAPNPALGVDARVAAPIRCQGHLLGHVWCTDRDQTMTDADLELVAAFADEAALVLYRDTLLVYLARSRERELLRDILTADPKLCADAALQLAEHDLFISGGRVLVLVLPLRTDDEERSSEDVKIAVEAALLRVRRHLAPKHSLHLVRPTHALLVASLADPGIRAHGVVAFAERTRGDLVAALGSGDAASRQIVGVGGVARGLAHAADSYQQALRAAEAGATLTMFGDIVHWDDLGIYQVLTEIPMDIIGANGVHASLARLLESRNAGQLLSTLERYFDLGGDTQRTATSLFLHRTTLYHRLRRIERIANVDLHNGDDRLILHLSLKLARLKGITWPADGEADDEDDGRP